MPDDGMIGAGTATFAQRIDQAFDFEEYLVFRGGNDSHFGIVEIFLDGFQIAIEAVVIHIMALRADGFSFFSSLMDEIGFYTIGQVGRTSVFVCVKG